MVTQSTRAASFGPAITYSKATLLCTIPGDRRQPATVRLGREVSIKSLRYKYMFAWHIGVVRSADSRDRYWLYLRRLGRPGYK